MADNRLYIGNTETLEWVCVSKIYNNNPFKVRDSDMKLINDIISTWDLSGSTDDPPFIFFTEKGNDETYERFISEGTDLWDKIYGK